MTTPTPFTPEQMRDRVYRHIAHLAAYWSAETYGKTERERMEAMCFSLLVMLDGYAADLPAFALFPRPHSSDKADHIERGEQWWDEDVPVITSHDDWYPFLRGEKLPDIT